MKDKNIADAFAFFAPTEEQKDRIYGKIASGHAGTDKKAKRGRIIFACAAAACFVLAAVAAMLLSGPGRPDSAAVAESGAQAGQTASNSAPASAVSGTVFSGFVFTAYRPAGGAEYLNAGYEQEAERVALQPEVEVLLSRYSPLMSSVPGLPFTVDIPDGLDVDTIRVSVGGGALCEWNQSTGIVTQKGSSADIAPGGTIYWSPLGESGADITEVTITVEGVADGVVVGTQEIVITRDEQGYFYATAGEAGTI